MKPTPKQIAQLMIDNSKGKVVMPKNFTEDKEILTPDEAISKAFLDVMELDANCGVEDIQKSFNKESVRLGIYSIVVEVINEGIMNESWRNPFFDQFVESRVQRRGDRTDFYIKSKQELHVSRVSKDGKVSLDRQRFDEGETINVKVETFAIKVYEHLARIILGRAKWSELVLALNAAVQKFIAFQTYAAFQSVCDAVPTALKSSGSYNEETILKLIRNVKMLSGADSVTLVGTGLALDFLSEGIDPSMYSDAMKNEAHANGRLRTWKGGIPMVELNNALLDGANVDFTSLDLKTVLKDDVIYVIPNNIGKMVKMIIEPSVVDLQASGVRYDDTVEFATRFSFGCAVVTGSAIGTIAVA